jgi:hypothetical protein
MRLVTLMVTIFLASSLGGQPTCSEEVKLLLSPSQVKAAIAGFQAHDEAHGLVYFYDTPTLELLAQGVILRWREGAKMDLTAKLRPPQGAPLMDTPGGQYECEMDLNDGVETKSLSLESKDLAVKAPESGEALLTLLSEGQKQLLKDAKARIDWRRVQRMTEIQSTSWTSHKKGPEGKVSLELWQWPGGSILEVSKKVEMEAGQATYAELKDIASRNGLALSTDQRSKTATVLSAIAHANKP